MNVVKKLSSFPNDDLQTFKIFEIIIAAVCIAIPALLRLADHTNPSFRGSISNYVYMPHSYIFGLLLCMAAMLFIFNGAVYFKAERKGLNLNSSGKWYNVILGVSLLFVILLPHREYRIPHLVFAGIFFFGNALVTGVFHQRKYRLISITLAILTAISFVFCFFKLLSVFWAEWLSLTVIGIHFMLEAEGVISYWKMHQQPAIV